MPGKRVFSEQEAAEIMQLAVRLQESSTAGGEYTPGVTEDELRRIAKEAGIDLAFLDKAIAGIAVEEKSERGPFNLTEEFTRVVEGEMDPEDFDKILKLVKPGHQRGISQVGRTLTGIGTLGPHMVHLNVESRKGRTKIGVKYSPVFAYLIGLHGPLIGSIIAIAATSENGAPMTGVAIATALLTAGGLAFNWLVKSGRKAAKQLTGKIAEVVEEESLALRKNLGNALTTQEEDKGLEQTT